MIDTSEPAGGKALIAEWTCGHLAGSMCAECFRELAMKAGELAEEGRLLREGVADLNAVVSKQADQLLELLARLQRTEQERDEAWAKIDQLLGRQP
jgi:hypothetical protein